MSGFQTHMLIGGVCGLALVRALDQAGISVALGLDVTILHALGPSGAGLAHLAAGGLPLIALSALLATLPDIDEPGSFIARRVQTVLTLACAGLVGLAASAARLPPAAWLLALALGVLLGAALGYTVLRLIRRAAGGHRRVTHSLLLALLFALAAGVLWRSQLSAWALMPAGLAWSILTHDLGDLCTPAGVPLLYPLSRTSVCVLPQPLCRVGEPLVALAASLVALLLLGIVHA